MLTSPGFFFKEANLYSSLSSFRFCFLGTTPVLAPNVWANENPKVDTRFRESNSGPYDCEADALRHDHGHHLTFEWYEPMS